MLLRYHSAPHKWSPCPPYTKHAADAPSFVCRRSVGRREIVNDDADRLLAKERVQIQAPLPGNVDHRPLLEVHRIAAPGGEEGGGSGEGEGAGGVFRSRLPWPGTLITDPSWKLSRIAAPRRGGRRRTGGGGVLMHWEGGRKGGGGGAVGGVQIQASLTRNVDHRPFLESTVEMNDGGGGGIISCMAVVI